MKQRCEYCQRTRTNDEPCSGCGQTEVLEKEDVVKSEFFYNGYFIRTNKSMGSFNMEFYFFRGRELVDTLKINWRDLMLWKEGAGIKDGEEWFHLIWDMFKKSQEEKHGLVEIYENDPRYKRIEVRLIEWGSNGRRRIKSHPGVTGGYSDERVLTKFHRASCKERPTPSKPSGSLKQIIRKSVGLDG